MTNKLQSRFAKHWYFHALHQSPNLKLSSKRVGSGLRSNAPITFNVCKIFMFKTCIFLPSIFLLASCASDGVADFRSIGINEQIVKEPSASNGYQGVLVEISTSSDGALKQRATEICNSRGGLKSPQVTVIPRQSAGNSIDMLAMGSPSKKSSQPRYLNNSSRTINPNQIKYNQHYRWELMKQKQNALN